MSDFKKWINSREYQELVEIMRKAGEETIKDLEDNLTQDMVTDIREWRVGEGPDDINTHSWRSIATVFAEKYPEFSANHNIESDNQVYGMWLCEAAMNLLKQKPEEGWN